MNISVIFLKLWSECGDREQNQFEATTFKLDEKDRHMSGSSWE